MEGRNINHTVAIIGTNFGVQAHLPAWRKQSHCVVKGLCGRNTEKTKVLAEKYGLKPYSNWKEIIDDETVDIISLAVPPAVQPHLAKEALKARKHLFIEKPLATTVKEAEEIVYTFSAYGKNSHITLNLNYSELKVFDWLRGELQQNNYLDNTIEIVDQWTVLSRSNANYLQTHLPHFLHYAQWILKGRLEIGSSIVSVGTGILQVGVRGLKGKGILTLHPGSHLQHEIRVEQGETTFKLFTPGGVENFMGFKNGDLVYNPVLSDRDETNTDGRIEATAKVIYRFVQGIDDNNQTRPDIYDGLTIQKLMGQVAERAFYDDI